MASQTDLLNDALGQIGASSIVSIDDGSINANYCMRFYPALRDGYLRAHHWNFALTRVVLSADATSPVTEYAYAYTLPADCLKVVNYAGGLPVTPATTYVYDPAIHYEIRYKIEGRKLLSNDGVVAIQYVRRVTNPDEWDPLFYQAMSGFLASKLASAIPKDLKKSQLLYQQAQQMLGEALAVDGQEGSIEAYVVDDFTWGR